MKGKQTTTVQVGSTQSFQVDQFQDGELYLKEIKFGACQLQNDFFRPFEEDKEEKQNKLGGKVLIKIQLIRNEQNLLDEVMNNCSAKVVELQDYIHELDIYLTQENEMKLQKQQLEKSSKFRTVSYGPDLLDINIKEQKKDNQVIGDNSTYINPLTLTCYSNSQFQRSQKGELDQQNELKVFEKIDDGE